MSFYTSLTGLNAATAMLGVTANNISNVGTTGFKRSRADFGDIFATSPLQKSSSTVGQGVSLKQVSQEFGQGNISFSANALDLAVTGDGFFPMRSADGLTQVYTRNGSFLLNEQFNVVNSAGQRLMAATVDSTGSANINERVVLTIPQKTSGEAMQTSQVSLGLNFPADAQIISADFNRANPATYNKSTAFTVYDNGGNGYLATIYYVKTQNANQQSPFNKWQTHVFVGDDPVNAALVQAADKTNSQLYVNQYGQIKPYSEVKDELIVSKTQMFSLDELTDKRNSTPAAVPGVSVTKAEYLTGLTEGLNFKTLANSPAGIGGANDVASTNSRGVTAVFTNGRQPTTAVGDPGGSTATSVITFGDTSGLAAGESCTIGGLTFTATTVCTATEVAAAFSGIDKYGTLPSSTKGTYTGSFKDYTTGAFVDGAVTVTAISNTPNKALSEELSIKAVNAGMNFRAGLKDMFKIDVDGTGNPITVDLSHLADLDTPLTGNAIAAEVTNYLNRRFGDETYFDFSSTANRLLTITDSGVTTTLAGGEAKPTSVSLDLSSALGSINPPKADGSLDYEHITVEQAVAAIQKTLNNKVTSGSLVTNADNTITDTRAYGMRYVPAQVQGDGTIDRPSSGVKVSYDYSTQGFKFVDGINELTLSSPNVTVGNTTYGRNELFGLTTSTTKLDEAGGYASKVLPNGAKPIRPIAEQRYGMKMTFDSVNKVFSLQSGSTGDRSSIELIPNANNALSSELFGLSFTSQAASKVDKSATALRGISSEPAVAVGTPPTINISNNFIVDKTNNSFVVTVDGVKGTVVIPPRTDYSLDTFMTQLQKGINAMGSTNKGSPTLVNGVKVTYDYTANHFVFTTGTSGSDSFIKISGASTWGLDQVEAGRGTTSTWIKPTQHSDLVGGVPAQKFIDANGNETTSGDGFVILPPWSPLYLDKGELTFDTGGKLVSPMLGTQLETVFLAGGKGALTVNVNYGASTQYSSPFAVLSQSQDGAPEGDLVGVTIGNDGLVSASFSNGTQKSLAKILLANFSSPVGLRQIGDSSFLASAASGDAILGTAGSAGFGTLRAGATERANVDLTQELVDLITAQRNFQANAKAIETSTTMTSAIINLRS
ncbi:MAG: flagellar hook-basal body complex protein [Betaproteobacteria bacterium]|nr:flagellar hook-basal body complex protein [Betaproteobacteria bacterium]